MSTILNAKIITSATDNLNEFKGILTVNPQENLRIDHIDGIVYLEIRGRLVSQKQQVISFNIDSNKIVSKGPTYEIPFSFILDKKSIPSYSGKNVSFSYKCEAQIFVNREDLEKLDRNILTRVKSFITADYSTKVSCYFKKKVKENIVLYITSPGDPHILYEKLNININNLQDLKIMEFKKDYNLNDFSIYTRKLYDKYVRS